LCTRLKYNISNAFEVPYMTWHSFAYVMVRVAIYFIEMHVTCSPYVGLCVLNPAWKLTNRSPVEVAVYNALIEPACGVSFVLVPTTLDSLGHSQR
jgi:hypothetical protein